MNMNRWLRVCGIAVFIWAGLGVNANAGTRALWVTRWDFKNEADVSRIFENAKNLGASHVLFQIRGNATVAYPSKIEPWAWELTGNDSRTTGLDPGWDPLAAAIREAQKNKLEIHAWMNVFPGWRGADPTPPGLVHPWVNHRSWFILDHKGVLLQPSKTFYTFLSPGNPEVRQYLASVFGEIARLYPNLDGLHMDYVRYPANKELGTYRNYSFDKASVTEFKKMYGKNPSDQSPEWPGFKCIQVTESIRTIRQAIRKNAPKMELSGTFVAELGKALNETGQNAETWIQDGLVDWAVPMAYQRKSDQLQKSLNELDLSLGAYKNKMVIGLNADFNSAGEMKSQIKLVNNGGWAGEAMFAYASLHADHVPNSKAATLRSIWQEDKLKDVLRREVVVKPVPIKTAKTVMESPKPNPTPAAKKASVTKSRKK